MHLVFSFLFSLAIVTAGSSEAHAADQDTVIPDPCAGPSALLSLLDRPTVSASPCVVPQGTFLLEMGFQRAFLRGTGGRADTYPQAEFRAGLPGRNEFILLPPNYVSQHLPDQDDSGWSSVTLGIKHSLGYNRTWLGAVNALFTLPSGGAEFGSHGVGVAINGIAAYSLTEQIGLSLQLGVSSQTDPSASGGGRFTSFVSNLVAAWQPASSLQFYGEIFGQTSTGAGKGAGYNFDGGVQYLLSPSWEVDLEGGLRLTGELGGFTHYFGAGMGFRF